MEPRVAPAAALLALPVLLACCLEAGAEEAGRVSVSLALSPVSPERVAPPVTAKLRAARAPGSGAAEDSRVWEVAAPATLQLDLAPEVSWSLSVEAAGYWAPAVVIPAGARPPVGLLLLPTETLVGQLVGKPGEKKPAALAVRFQSAPGQPKPGVPVAQILCPVQGDRWRCEVPAGTLDL